MKAFYQKYERHFTTLAFITGFIFDNFALREIDKWFVHLVLLSYLVLVAIAIILFNGFDTERERVSLFGRSAAKVISWFPIGIQFSLGTILSGSLVFYSRSASLSVSWPFLILLIALIVSNELIHSRYTRLVFQLASFFTAVFLYMSFSIPILLKNVGTLSFLVSGALSVLLVIVVSRFVRMVAQERFRKSRAGIWASVLFLYAGFNVFYFLNLIPPLPLSLGEIGIYHSITRDLEGNYLLRYEKAPWYYLRKISPVFHSRGEEVAYAFSSVVAPSRLETGIVHEWSFLSESGEWTPLGVVPFSIVGGRDEGYRGYSVKTIFPGKWRVDVKTKQGRLIGRTNFSIVSTVDNVPLEMLTR